MEEKGKTAQIRDILKTILRKDLNPVKVNDDIPMVIEFEIRGSMETMKIGSNYTE